MGHRRQGKRGRAGGVLPLLCILLGLAILAVPVAWDLHTTSMLVAETSGMSSTQVGYDNPSELGDAEAYNRRLAGEELPGGWSPEDISDYEQQMDVDSAMCWVEIPAIALKMPVYHGTAETSLAGGVGHLEGTSLPVGGASANTVLTAHSGMEGARAFDDIRRLREGDVVLLHSLGQVLAYRVNTSVTISQSDYEAWRRETAVAPGQDELTLVTCTPYGVNDHRLCVHCYRTEYDLESMEEAPMTAYLNPRYVALAVALAAIAVAGVGAVVRHRRAVKQAKCRDGTRQGDDDE